MKKTPNTQSVKDQFIDFWSKNNFEEIRPVSVIPPENWTSTLFINSGLIRYIGLIEKTGGISHPLATCQPCIKIGSGKFSLDEMMLRDGYFTFFEQLTCGVDANEINEECFVEKVWDYLISVVGLAPNKIHVGVHFAQSAMKNFWVKVGVLKQNTVFPDDKALVLNLPEKSVYGIYSPFYYDRGKNHHLSCKKDDCDINCNCGRFLELGDIGSISIRNTKIIDHGIGLERITSVQKEMTQVIEIPEFSVLISLLQKELGTNFSHLAILSDHLRSIIVLLFSGLKPGNKKKEYALRNLIRRTFWLIFETNPIDREKIINIYSQVISEMNKFYPYLATNKDIIQEVEQEAKKYSDLIIQGKKIIKKYLKKNGAKDLSEEELSFFHETYGLPKELTKILWEQ